MIKYKRISSFKIKEARESDERFDALAFAVCIKLKYASSAIHKADIRSLRANFGIGTEKASKVLKNALKYGYIKEENGMYIAQKIKSVYLNKKNGILSTGFDNITLKYDNEKITLKNVRKELEKLTVYNHIKTNEKVRTLKQCKRNPSNLKEYKAAKATIQRWCVDKFDTDGGLSYTAIAKRLNVSKNKAIAIIKQMVVDKMIEKTTFKIQFCDPDLINSYKKVFEHKLMLFYQPSNHYSPCLLFSVQK